MIGLNDRSNSSKTTSVLRKEKSVIRFSWSDKSFNRDNWPIAVKSEMRGLRDSDNCSKVTFKLLSLPIQSEISEIPVSLKSRRDSCRRWENVCWGIWVRFGFPDKTTSWSWVRLKRKSIESMSAFHKSSLTRFGKDESILLRVDGMRLEL